MWNIACGWGVVSFVVAILIAVGLRMNSTPIELSLSRIFFSAAAIIALAKIGTWILSIESILGWKRIGLVSILFCFVGAGWAGAWLWANNRELMMTSGILTPDNKPTPPNRLLKNQCNLVESPILGRFRNHYDGQIIG